MQDIYKKFQRLFDLLDNELTPEQWIKVYEACETVGLDPAILAPKNEVN